MKHSLDLGLLILRVGFSALMLTHGISKIPMLFKDPIKFADPIGLGEPISLILTLIGEVVAPVLIIIGYKTKWAAFPAAITMLVAAFVIHFNDALHKKEMALLYLIVFVTLIFTGAGKFSVDGIKSR